MASYNAGRSLGRLLTDGAFDTLERDSSGYVSVADAADQLMTRRRRRGESSDGLEDAGNQQQQQQQDDEQQKSAMRGFLERTVATFCLSRPGRLNRREYAKMYETFLKRPADFCKLMMLEHGDDNDGGDSSAESNSGEQQQQQQDGASESAQLPQPAPISRDQLRSLVDEVNRRLATESGGSAQQAGGHSAAATGTAGTAAEGGGCSGCTGATFKPGGADDLQLD